MSKLPALKKNNEYRRIYSRGKYAVSSSLVMYTLPNRFGAIRIGITTSKKVGNSVQRNRIRRLIRENIRLVFPKLVSGTDLVVIARKADPEAGLQSIGKEVRFLLKKLDILIKGIES